MTKIWITPECYQAHPENAVYNAQGDRLCTDGATMEVLEAEDKIMRLRHKDRLYFQAKDG